MSALPNLSALSLDTTSGGNAETGPQVQDRSNPSRRAPSWSFGRPGPPRARVDPAVAEHAQAARREMDRANQMANEALRDCQQHAAALRMQLSYVRTKHRRLNGELDALQAQVSALEGAKGSATLQDRKLRQQLRKVADELGTLKNEREALQLQLSAEQQQARVHEENLHKELRDVEAVVARLRAAMTQSDAQEEPEWLRNAAEELDKEMKEAEQAADSVAAQLSIATAEVEQLRAELDSCKAEAAVMEQQVQTLQRNLEIRGIGGAEELDALKQDVGRLRSQILATSDTKKLQQAFWDAVRTQNVHNVESLLELGLDITSMSPVLLLGLIADDHALQHFKPTPPSTHYGTDPGFDYRAALWDLYEDNAYTANHSNKAFPEARSKPPSMDLPQWGWNGKTLEKQKQIMDLIARSGQTELVLTKKTYEADGMVFYGFPRLFVPELLEHAFATSLVSKDVATTTITPCMHQWEIDPVSKLIIALTRKYEQYTITKEQFDAAYYAERSHQSFEPRDFNSLSGAYHRDFRAELDEKVLPALLFDFFFG